MFEIVELLDADFDEIEPVFTTEPTIEDDPNDDYSWLPLDRWADRRVTI